MGFFEKWTDSQIARDLGCQEAAMGRFPIKTEYQLFDMNIGESDLKSFFHCDDMKTDVTISAGADSFYIDVRTSVVAVSKEDAFDIVNFKLSKVIPSNCLKIKQVIEN